VRPRPPKRGRSLPFFLFQLNFQVQRNKKKINRASDLSPPAGTLQSTALIDQKATCAHADLMVEEVADRWVSAWKKTKPFAFLSPTGDTPGDVK